MERHTYFIGYDAREDEAAKVAAYSILSRSNSRAYIYILDHMTLRRLKMFDRPWSITDTGQMVDDRDGRPFSTAFSHSRFLVFKLANALKCTGPCMFVDCDWLFLDDPTKIMDQQAERRDQIGVVSRERKVEENSIKMDGMVQQNYDRKLWSALFTFMPSAKWDIEFTEARINTRPGREMHGFFYMPQSDFWEIDPAWHYIPSLDDKPKSVKGIHFSEFSPWLNPDRNADYPTEFENWRSEYHKWLFFAAYNEGLKPWRDLELDLAAANA